MVINFDKDNIASYYKRRFGECLDEEDYERALDYLIKYREAMGYPEFHLTCGMLYLNLTRESDDAELVYLAYREFMLHILRYPDCEAAYRYLIMTEYMRAGKLSAEYVEWLAKRNIDISAVAMGIMKSCIDPNGGPFPTELFFRRGDYGEIDSYRLQNDSDGEVRPENDGMESAESAESKSNDKIIQFDLSKCGSGAQPVFHSTTVAIDNPEADIRSIISKYLDVDEAGYEYYDDEDYDEYDDYDDYDDIDFEDDSADARIDGASDMPISILEDDPTSQKLALAEKLCSSGDYSGALEAVADITVFDKKYYFALIMRGLVYLSSGDLESAESVLNKAKSLRPHHALVGTMLCDLYEAQEKPEKIPATLDDIDITTFMSGEHVYRAFDYIVKYYDADKAPDIIEEYIEEYNLMNMRLIYAQMLYNRGEKTQAVEELYLLTRIFYDDINIAFFYASAKLGIDRMPLEEEAPQSMLSFMVDEFMALVLSGNVSEKELTNDMFSTMLEFFISLEFRNDNKMLVKMFDTVKKIASNVDFEQKSRDALVSPYVEPIVKGLILSELLKRDRDSEFLAEVMYKPISSDCIGRLGAGYPERYYTAYAFVAMLCGEAVDAFIPLAKRCKYVLKEDYGDALTYYLIKTSLDSYNVELDERYIQALGYKTKRALSADYNKIKKIMNAIDKEGKSK
ncbi:MAG: hypothetical protein J1F39_06535 [Clostridiales bacterium]|nr:hypothetical protein [Clostridiales bacterium]